MKCSDRDVRLLTFLWTIVSSSLVNLTAPLRTKKMTGGHEADHHTDKQGGRPSAISRPASILTRILGRAIEGVTSKTCGVSLESM